MMEDDLGWKTTYDRRRLMMKNVNEDDLKNKEDLHRWQAHGAGHIPLCGIFFSDFGIRFFYPNFFGPSQTPLDQSMNVKY